MASPRLRKFKETLLTAFAASELLRLPGGNLFSAQTLITIFSIKGETKKKNAGGQII